MSPVVYLFLMLLASSASRPLTEGDTVVRLNYGTIFNLDNRLVTASQYWKHTFDLKLPTLDYDDIDIHDCTTTSNTPLCEMHNVFVFALNQISQQLRQDINTTNTQISQILGPRRRNTGSETNTTLQSRSKRALLPFVGDIASSLFGVATTNQVRMLARHINALYTRQQAITKSQIADIGLFAGYTRKTNTRIHNLMEAVTQNHDYVEHLNKAVLNANANTDELERQMSTFIPILIRRTAVATNIQLQLHSLLLGLHDLAQKQLSPRLVPADVLRETIQTTERELQKQHPSFYITNKHPAFYYQSQDVLYSFVGKSVLVTIVLPISTKGGTYDLYHIHSMPVPFNHSTLHVTVMEDLPPFLAISVDNTSFMEIASSDLQRCTEGPIRHCPTLTSARSTSDPSCALALFSNTSPRKYCSVKVKEEGLPTFVLEMSPGRVLFSNIPEIIYTCNNEVKKENGCLFCEGNIPCECAVAAGTFQIPPRLVNCEPEQTSVTKQFPVNLALLQQFFNDSDIAHISASDSFNKPLPVNIPDLKIFDSKFKTEKQKDQKLEASLTLIADKMKKNKPVFRDMPWYDDMMPEDSFSWPHIIAFVSLGLSVVLTGAVFIMCKRLRTLTLILGMLTNPNPGMSLVKAAPTTRIPTLNWNPNTDTTTTNYGPDDNTNSATVTCSKFESDYFLLALELLSLILLLVFLIKCGHAVFNTMLYRSDVYLEITNGRTFVDIYLTSLTYCPTEYDLHLKFWVHSLTLLQRMLGTDDLHISWPQFSLKEINTGQIIQLPKTIKLSRYQCFQLKTLIKGHYSVYPKLIHGGRAFYVTRYRDVQNDMHTHTSIFPSAPLTQSD